MSESVIRRLHFIASCNWSLKDLGLSITQEWASNVIHITVKGDESVRREFIDKAKVIEMRTEGVGFKFTELDKEGNAI